MTQYSHSQIKSALMRARTLIEDRARWTKGTERRKIVVGADEPENYAYCAIGAIHQATNLYGNDDLLVKDHGLGEAARTAFRTYLGRPISGWNDSNVRTHQQVLAAFDGAIKRETRLAEQEGSAR